VIVISHNYGRFLAECLESVLAQTARPSEILVIDDQSTDDTPSIAQAFADRGVLYLHVACGNVHRARCAGFESTTADILCFLDADDLLAPDYLAEGLKLFSAPAVGVVYSDVEYFMNRAGRSDYPATFDRAQLERDNYLHAGSLVRRDALLLSRVFEKSIDPLLTQGDWFLWRHVLRDGWTAAKQPGLYRYRQHSTNWSLAMQQAEASYFEYASLAHETVTLFIPLSGRRALWPDLAAYLDRQTWPHDQIRLVLLDTSQNKKFARAVRTWALKSDYRDVRCIEELVARAGVADDDRHEDDVKTEVRAGVARVYNRIAREVTTDYVWVVEDDILPPDDACERLLQGFDRRTISVSGLYLSRYDGLPCAWGADHRNFTQLGEGLQLVAGNGFGCVVVRGGVLRHTVFRGTGDYDCEFYRQIEATGDKAKIDWRVICEHRSVHVPTIGAMATRQRQHDVSRQP
jgi:cellulose synthase/poly-beta-1,6-N-acetylglucosamine synthase-like glycosyltransferase